MDETSSLSASHDAYTPHQGVPSEKTTQTSSEALQTPLRGVYEVEEWLFPDRSRPKFAQYDAEAIAFLRACAKKAIEIVPLIRNVSIIVSYDPLPYDPDKVVLVGRDAPPTSPKQAFEIFNNALMLASTMLSGLEMFGRSLTEELEQRAILLNELRVQQQKCETEQAKKSESAEENFITGNVISNFPTWNPYEPMFSLSTADVNFEKSTTDEFTAMEDNFASAQIDIEKSIELLWSLTEKKLSKCTPDRSMAGRLFSEILKATAKKFQAKQDVPNEQQIRDALKTADKLDQKE